jgi:hypothetical protein
MGKNQDPDPGSRSRIPIQNEHPGSYFRELRQFFCFKILTGKFFGADPDPGSGIFLTVDPGSGMEKTSRISNTESDVHVAMTD